MKKRNLIATNCPPGVECDGKSADDGDKPGKLPNSKYALGPVDSRKVICHMIRIFAKT